MKKCSSKKYLMPFLFAFLVVPVLNLRADITKNRESELLDLKKACVVLEKEPRDEEGLKELLVYAKSTNGIDRLRSRAMAAYALSALFSGNTNLYISVRQSHARAYPNDKHLLRADLDSCYVICQECDGQGFIKMKCPFCEKAGKCKACKGTGKRLSKRNGSKRVVIKCPLCGGSGKTPCEKCKGTGFITRRCPKCRGNPVSFSATTKIYDDFALIVKGITKWINNEDIFYQLFEQAKNEKNMEKRVAALESLLATYSYREESTEVEKLLAVDRTVISKQEEKQKEQLAKQTRDLTMLRGLKNSDNQAAAIKTLNQYLEANPEAEHRLELQAMVNHMAEELKRKTIKRRSLYIFGGLFLLICAMSCIRINHYNYNVFSRNRDDESTVEKE